MKFTTFTTTAAAALFLQALQVSAQGIGGGVAEVDLTATTTAKAEPTTVWVTQTLANGAKTVVASIYTQQFPQLYASVYVPSSGSIGLGTQTGSVGIVRETQATGGGARMSLGSSGDAWLLGLGVGIVGMVGGGLLVL
ncbi:uncharacterized protein H6S33_011583 [Morchella sextelata]|uniref:uncharacterized protein n=1 Tax=Morchella sextelata TaxID=1174677 RepID=UPI001D04B776|nr:uncharacterized protein H6S33_011583 [Morchella sextelata]KAH0611156.1 hypothetical protein H6S33_011583 [Morchella sextelata]